MNLNCLSNSSSVILSLLIPYSTILIIYTKRSLFVKRPSSYPDSLNRIGEIYNVRVINIQKIKHSKPFPF